MTRGERLGHSGLLASISIAQWAWFLRGPSRPRPFSSLSSSSWLWVPLRGG